MALHPAHPGKNAFIEDALTLTRQRRLYLLTEVHYPLIEEALELLLRREERRLACRPDIVIVIAEGKVEGCLSEEEEMSYRTIDEDTNEIDEGIILAKQVDDLEKELQHRQHHDNDEEENEQVPN